MFLLDTSVISELRKLGDGKADALIAATAIVHGMAVITRNVADFETTGAEIIDPWAGA